MSAKVMIFPHHKKPKIDKAVADGVADLAIGITEDLKVALDALRKIETGRITGEKDGADTCSVLRSIAGEALQKLSHYQKREKP